MLKLNFNLRHQDIRLVNKGAVVASDSKNYLVAKFYTLSDDWETPLTAIFTDDKHKQPYAVIVGANEELADNECFVPWEVLTDECNVYVSVYCGNLHTTVTAAFKVRKSGYTDGETPPPPSPTVYDIILQAINDLRTNKQDKLTAGENITIDENNVISAEGGVTDYDELENKPQINGYVLSGNKSSDDLRLMSIKTITGVQRNVISVNYNYNFNKNVCLERDIYINEDSYNNRYSVGVQDNFFRDYSGTMGVIKHGEYDFDSIEKNYAFCGCLLFSKSELRHVPGFINQFRDTNIRIIQLFTPKSGAGNISLMIRYVIGTDSTSLELRTFYQTATATLQQDGSYSITYQSNWQELTGGGAQIVSGVVNANGTITFTDSEGNSFTTSGESVIGPEGAPGQDYVLTNTDKQDIANIVLGELPTTQGVLYGNQSN